MWRALTRSKPLRLRPLSEAALAELPARRPERPRLDGVELVRKAQKRLMPRERETVVTLFGLDGTERVTARELAAREGVTAQAVSARYRRALRRMRKYLRRQEDGQPLRTFRRPTPA